MAVPQIVEATLDNLEVFHEDLVRTYEREGVMCPMPDATLAYPPIEDCREHLRRGNRLIGHYDRTFLTHVLLVDRQGRIRTCFGIIDKAAMEAAQWAFVDYFEGRGEKWVLDTGTPGSITRTFFERYAPAGGPFDIEARGHPGGQGKKYRELDDDDWTLTLNGDRTWEVKVRGRRQR